MRQQVNVGQEFVSEDINSLQGRLERGLMDRIIYELIGRVSDGFFGDGFNVIRTSSVQVQVQKGLGFQIDDTGTEEPVKKPLALDADLDVDIDTPDSSNDRIDIIVVKNNRFNVEAETRKFKDEFTGSISTQEFTISTDWKADVLYVAGTPAGSPSVPATPAGYISVSEFLVTSSTGIAASGAMTDKRSLLPVATGLSDTGSSEWDAIVGTIGIDQGANYADLKSALDNSVNGWKVLVLRNESLSAIPVVTKNNIEIVYKRGVTFSKDTAVLGLQIDGNDCKVVNARFLDFDTASDFGIKVSAGALRTYIDAARFNNCDGNINDLGTETYINLEYTE